MKNAKSLLAIIALFSINLANARVLGGGAAQPTEQTPVTTPTTGTKTPSTAKTFKQLVDYVKTAPNVWDSSTNLLNNAFVQQLLADCDRYDINDDQVNILLQIARDYHAQFTGDSRDAAILANLEAQRQRAITPIQKKR